MVARITLFSLSTCPHCHRAKALLEKLGWEYHEISLSKYPEKRGAMVKAAGKLSVPQIFFNNKHLGGASELVDLHERGLLEAIHHEDQPEQLLAELEVPDYPPTEEQATLARTDEVVCVGNNQCMDYCSLMELLSTQLDIKDRSYHLRTYPMCFVGKEAVEVFMRCFNLSSRDEAVKIGKELFRHKFFFHVCLDHDFKDEYLFYRLQKHAQPLTLNTYRVWGDRVDNPMVTIKKLRQLLGQLQSQHTDSTGGVDYVAMSEDKQWPVFQEASCEVQRISLADMSRITRVAFVINLYNLAVTHAFVQLGIPQTDFKRMSFFDDVKYNVGGALYSLNDLENGILRGNKRPPYHLTAPFGSKDPRAAAVVSGGEKRIHFALNCGAKSCPPVKHFTAEALNEELDVVARAFCEDDNNVHIDTAT
eukprot:Sspe_Gene.90740::Locus_62220_Transcript_2_3_Confidence_0.375_Length_1302::g.90740::m.90740